MNPRDGLRWSLGVSVFTGGALALLAIYTMATKKTVIPYYDGGMWSVFLFGSLAAASYQELQQLKAAPFDRSSESDRDPWERDPDYWKR